MWQQLGAVALEEGDIAIAERCAAALGDVSRARFLHKVGVGEARVSCAAALLSRRRADSALS